MASEDPLLVRTDKGSTVLYKGIHLYPPQDPRGYACRKAASARIGPGSLVLVPSVGLGYGLTELLDRLEEGSAVLCVESDQKVMALAAAEGLPVDHRLVILRTDAPSAVAQAFERMGVGRFRRAVEVPLCAGYRLEPELYRKFREVVEARIRTHWQNRATLIAMGSLWVKNLLENLPLLPNEGDFTCLSTDLPVVVTGAGPSLEASIPTLKRLRSRFLLLAADTALPLLRSESLRPDLVLALESQIANLKDFLPRPDPGMALACEISAHPALPRLFPGNTFFFSSTFAPLSLLDRLSERGLLPARFPALGSVGVAAVHAALALTRADIYLTGLDFSFPGSRTHARGTPTYQAMLAHTDRFDAFGQASFRALASRPRIAETDKLGGRVQTDLVLRSYRDQLTAEIEGTRRVWDIGETGLSLGAGTLSVEELEGRLQQPATAAGRSSNPLIVAHGSRLSMDSVRGFLSDEEGILSRAAEATSRLLSENDPVEPSDTDRELLRAVGYAYVHFPEEIDLARLSRSFLARARVAVLYYTQRLRRVLSLL